MNTHIDWLELARLPISKMEDVLLARFITRREATKMAFPPAVLTALATAVSEITRNVVQHSGSSGEIQIGRIHAGDRVGLRIIVTDTGQGMEHPEKYLEEGKYATLGAGLAGSRRLVDQFQIQSMPGSGTTVTMDMWKKA